MGALLDDHHIGLKEALENDEAYKRLKIELAEKRLDINLTDKKKRRIIQDNIKKISEMIYGFNSYLRTREISRGNPKAPVQARINLEHMETDVENTLNDLLLNIQIDWNRDLKIEVNLNA